LGGGVHGHAGTSYGAGLRFVDAVRKPAAPLLAGLAATVVALPIAALPLVERSGRPAAFGVGVAGGVASGRPHARAPRPGPRRPSGPASDARGFPGRPATTAQRPDGILRETSCPRPSPLLRGAVHLGNAGRTGVAICRVSNASATAQDLHRQGERPSASMSQSSPTIS